MTVLPDEARRLLESDALVHLVTINSDGSPQLRLGRPGRR
jgi:hypothetical protein